MGSPIRIGVTSNARRWAPSWWCIATALRLVGATPRRITVRDPAPGEAFDALVVSGGDDIGPDLYGGAELPKARIDHERDALEVRWLRWAMDRHVPVLGICRGAQLLNAVRGGSLLQDITALRRRTSNRASLLPRKPVTVTSDSRLAAITARTRLHVNSLHHQAIDRPGDGLEIVARDGDDICQAIESSAGPALLGVQWHPEYLLYLPSHLALFRSLVERAREHRSDSPEPKTMAAASLAPATLRPSRSAPGNGGAGAHLRGPDQSLRTRDALAAPADRRQCPRHGPPHRASAPRRESGGAAPAVALRFSFARRRESCAAVCPAIGSPVRGWCGSCPC